MSNDFYSLAKLADEEETPLHRKAAEAWRDSVGSVQAGRLATHTAGLSLLGFLAGKMASGPLTMRLRHTISLEDKRQVSKRMGLLGSLLGGAAGLYTGSRGVDFNDSETALRSLFEKDYWKKNPERLQSVLKETREKDKKLRYGSPGSVSYDPMRDLEKTSTESGGFSAFMPDIGLQDSKNLIMGDLYMDPVDKGRVDTILSSSDEDEDGRISQFDLSKGALKAGLGFVPSYFAGSVFGKTLKLPNPVRKRVSLLGGIAGAALNSGLLQQE